jgi:hypothetical protein
MLLVYKHKYQKHLHITLALPRCAANRRSGPQPPKIVFIPVVDVTNINQYFFILTFLHKFSPSVLMCYFFNHYICK